MRVCVFGAGAVGGHIATRLALGGAEVSIVARGANLAAIREKGLTVRAPDGEHHARVAAAEDPAALGPQDAVLVTVKAPSLPGVAAAIAPLLGPETFVAFVMNGVPWWYFDRHGGPLDGTRLPELDPGEQVRRAIGVERSVGGVVHSATTVLAPGLVQAVNPVNRVILGELDGRDSPRLAALAGILCRGGMQGEVTRDIRGEMWAKLAGGLSNAPICVLTRKDIAQSFADPVIRAEALRLLQEALAIAQALGVTVAMEPETRIAQLAAFRHKPSILQDLELGRPMEIEAMLQAPLRLARLAGVATPALDLSVALATAAAEAAGLHRPA
ncbi:ketopantoate reductase family protein [Falsiroseomonas sp.]|uniref:ketopantoate reductase family protein n=1 Tax=Falsiroseomonas sp. TaxID=2870721 RepID=UPI003F6FAE67